MYRNKEVEARANLLSPTLRVLAKELLRRGEQFGHRIPVDEALDSDLESQLRRALWDPALKQEWIEFWRDLRDACRADQVAIMRGEHDHELYCMCKADTFVEPTRKHQT